MKPSSKMAHTVGLMLPVVLVVILLGIIYLPRMVVTPTFDFLFAIDNEFYSPKPYSVSNGQLLVASPGAASLSPQRDSGTEHVRFFRHSVDHNISQEISAEEAMKYSIDHSSLSPDGFEVVCGTQGEAFFIFIDTYNDCSRRYLKGRGISERLNLPSIEEKLQLFQFLGWINQ